MLESKIALVAKVVRGLNFPNDDDVLDTDSELAIGVVAGLWRYFMSGWNQRKDTSRAI